jgi:hypothetical protein
MRLPILHRPSLGSGSVPQGQTRLGRTLLCVTFSSDCARLKSVDQTQRRRLTGFRVALRRIMDARAMRHWDELCRTLRRAGYPRSHHTVMGYINGEHVVEEMFVRYVALALSLRNDERERLAYAWAYLQGQDDGDPKTDLAKVAKTLGWDEEKKRREAYRYLFEPIATQA